MRKTHLDFDQTHMLNEDRITIKTLVVYSGEATSLQKHKKRAEVWIPQTDSIIVKTRETYLLKENDVKIIPKGYLHRIVGIRDVSIITEVSFGDLKEEDIERIHDFYGRI